MRFLVASLRAELLPLAHRLRREGHEVQALVWRERYENAWGGSIEKIAKRSDGTLNDDALRPQVEAAEAGELIVVTNVRRVAELFHRARRLFPRVEGLAPSPPADRLMLGGWFDGESLQAPHLLVADRGAWSGGTGPAVLGGLTLIRLGGELGGSALPPFIAGASEAALERLKSVSFRGLFHFDVEEETTTGEMRLKGMDVGWGWLHTQAFAAELQNLSETLGGGPPCLLHKYVSVLPVTLPPWPNEKRSQQAKGIPVEGLTTRQQGSCYWYDVEIDQKAGKLRTAGLDGLLCVTTGASDSTPALARARALELALRLQVPEKQYRSDVGSLVDPVLSTLEDRWGVVV